MLGVAALVLLAGYTGARTWHVWWPPERRRRAVLYSRQQYDYPAVDSASVEAHEAEGFGLDP